MAKKMSSKKKGTIVISLVLLAMVVLAASKLFKEDESSTNTETTKSNITSSADAVDVLPGTSERKAYNELQQKENEKKAKEVLGTDKSSLPVLVNNNKDDKNDPFNDLNLNITQPQIKEETPVIDTTPPEVPAPVVQPAPVVVQPPVSQPVAMQPVATYNSSERAGSRQKVNAQLQGYMSLWTPSPSDQERNFTGANIEDSLSNGATGNVQNVSNTSKVATASGASLVRAGTMIPAVMITGLNSDTPGPVLAQIVSGPLKGAKVIGEMRSNDKNIVVQFNKLSIKGHNKTYNISAVAVDPNTTSTALATDVNNHYFQRYVLGLAAEFVSGYGEAVQNKGTTTTVGPMGNVTQTKGDLNHSEIAESAFGKVGQKLGREIERDTNRRPTVTVDSGTPLALMFLNDF